AAIVCLIGGFGAPYLFLLAGLFALLCLGCGLAHPCLERYVESAEYQSRNIPYIPPVTPDTLPDEEVLVRGVQKPTSEPDPTLLLPVEERSSAHSEELLRST